MDRIQKLSVESACFEFPSILYFDISIINDSTTSGTLSVKRYLGRYVMGRDRDFRVDFLKYGDPDGGREAELHHALCSQGGQYKIARESASRGFYEFQVERSHPMPIFVSRCNPFRCIVQGSFEFDISKQADSFKEIADHCEEYEKEVGMIRSKVKPSKMSLEFFQDEVVDWKVSKVKVYLPTGSERVKMLMGKERLKVDDVKNWHVFLEVDVQWQDVEGVGPVPCWVLSKAEGVLANDPTECEEMEVFFFGFQFENLPLETLFDEKRFTKEGIQQDFKIEEVKKMAEKAKAEISAARKSSSKK